MENSPAPKRRNRAQGWTAKAQDLFITALAATGSVVQAADAAGRSASTAYRLRASPHGADFASRWAAAQAEAYARLHDVAMDRARNGTEIPVWHRGEQVGTRNRPSDRLLIHMLGRLDPDREGAPSIKPCAPPPAMRLTRRQEVLMYEYSKAVFAAVSHNRTAPKAPPEIEFGRLEQERQERAVSIHRL